MNILGFFDESGKKYIKEIYSPADEGCFEMISLEEQGREGFNVYYKGFTSAYNYCISKSKCGYLSDEMFGPVMKKWKEVIDILEQDERFDPDFTL